MESRGLFLTPWTLDFNLEAEITTIPVWFKLPYLPLVLCSEVLIREIGNKIGKFIAWVQPNETLLSCACICVEVNLEEGLLEVVQHSLEGWNHIQVLVYEQLPFKCNSFHAYGKFSRPFPNIP